MNKDSLIYVAGHRGLVGSALVRRLHAAGYNSVLAASHQEVDLTDRTEVRDFLNATRPEYVFIAAAKVGGVCSNDAHEADFLLQNLQIQNNIIAESQRLGVKKLLFLGSACVYPRLAEEPVRETALLSGPLEPSNQWYAVAKIAGLKLCQAMRRQYGCDFISAMPTNLFGPGDKYDLTSCHVLPALIAKFHAAKVQDASHVTLWGDGSPRREFLYSDDCADACITLMEKYSDESPVNIGTGRDMTISELADAVADTVEFTGQTLWDRTKPNGTPRRLLDTSILDSLGWEPKVSFRAGLKLTYREYFERFLDPKLVYDNMR